MMAYLSSATTVVQSAHKSLESITAVLVNPSVGYIHVLHLRHIDERVMIAIHRQITATIMRQDTRMKRFMDVMMTEDLPSAHDIGLRHQFGIEHQVD